MRGQNAEGYAMPQPVRTGQEAVQVSRGQKHGAKTREGRAKIAEAQRNRWAKWRAGKSM